jgi:hypothetical protein
VWNDKKKIFFKINIVERELIIILYIILVENQ